MKYSKNKCKILIYKKIKLLVKTYNLQEFIVILLLQDQWLFIEAQKEVLK